jgi:glutamate racemase
VSESHSSPSAIGVFDSGVGGLSVLREIHRLLPDIPTLYFADQGHLPYGPRPADELRLFVEAIAEFLIQRGQG